MAGKPVTVVIRDFALSDVPELLGLMRELAAFEDYLDDFRVSEADLIAYGLGKAPAFRALVADKAGSLVGMAVSYDLPWTYHRTPTHILKELFVSERHRSEGIGERLFEAVVAQAARQGAAEVQWLVMRGNARAVAFYKKFGGRKCEKWTRWHLRPG